ncbi:hypothetical protein QYM36_015341 [Artemia franciscana]|uniref:Craniofacial development protein 2-like n=1 Tax=Artemia franciscana TaxID=6661 RepID=A0AA88HHJ1_ARTSF|nr:hypothetical protein QYM36_015341 [Artemia franciscana]
MRTLDKFRIDTAGISETRLTGFSTLTSETYHILYSGLETRKEAGVGMALSSRAKKCLVDRELINERILCARFATSQAKLTVIVVYAPTNDTVDQTKDYFYRVLSNVVAIAHRHDIVTLCGDFNAKVGSDAPYAPAILGKHGLGEINDNGVRSVDFCATHELIVGASCWVSVLGIMTVEGADMRAEICDQLPYDSRTAGASYNQLKNYQAILLV